jgi:bacterioferritin
MIPGAKRHRKWISDEFIPDRFIPDRSEHVRKSGVTAMGEFVSDIKRIQEYARRHMDNGAVTEGCKADRKRVIGVLNQARHRDRVRAPLQAPLLHGARHALRVGETGILAARGRGAAARGLVAERIIQLGGEPNFNP